VHKNGNPDNVVVHQHHSGAMNTQELGELQKLLSEATNPVLVAHAEYGIDVWIWDLRITC